MALLSNTMRFVDAMPTVEDRAKALELGDFNEQHSSSFMYVDTDTTCGILSMSSIKCVELKTCGTIVIHSDIPYTVTLFKTCTVDNAHMRMWANFHWYILAKKMHSWLGGYPCQL